MAQGCGDALARRVGAMDPRYLANLIDGYRTAVDEIDVEAA